MRFLLLFVPLGFTGLNGRFVLRVSKICSYSLGAANFRKRLKYVGKCL